MRRMIAATAVLLGACGAPSRASSPTSSTPVPSTQAASTGAGACNADADCVLTTQMVCPEYEEGDPCERCVPRVAVLRTELETWRRDALPRCPPARPGSVPRPSHFPTDSQDEPDNVGCVEYAPVYDCPDCPPIPRGAVCNQGRCTVANNE